MPAKKTLPLKVCIAVPRSGKRQGVLVVHAWWGLNDFVRGFCDRLTGKGFVALAPDLFEGQTADTIASAKRLRSQPQREPARTTLTRAAEALTQHPAVQGQSIGVVGFSMGGHWALWLAQQRALPVAATVTFYGTRSGDFAKSRSAFLGHFAENDEWVSASGLKKLTQALAASGNEAEICVYPGTAHWFFETGPADTYHAEAAALAWERTVKFLRKHLKP